MRGAFRWASMTGDPSYHVVHGDFFATAQSEAGMPNRVAGLALFRRSPIIVHGAITGDVSYLTIDPVAIVAIVIT
jgi:hypothetical protein